MSFICVHASQHFGDNTKDDRFRGFSTSVSKSLENVAHSPSVDQFSKQQKLQELMSVYQKQGKAAKSGISAKIVGSSDTTGVANGSGTGKKVFDDTIKFPTEFMMKIVGTNESTFVPDILRAIGECLDKQRMDSIAYSTKETAGGKYVSITVKSLFHSSQELYAVYEAIAKDKRVKFTL